MALRCMDLCSTVCYFSNSTASLFEITILHDSRECTYVIHFSILCTRSLNGHPFSSLAPPTKTVRGYLKQRLYRLVVGCDIHLMNN